MVELCIKIYLQKKKKKKKVPMEGFPNLLTHYILYGYLLPRVHAQGVV